MLPNQTDKSSTVSNNVSLAMVSPAALAWLTTSQVTPAILPSARSRIGECLMLADSGFGTGSTGDRRAGNVNLDAAALAAGAKRAAVVDADVTAFGGGAGAAVVDMAVEDQTGSNAGADGGVENLGVAFSRAPQNFREGRGVGIIFNFYRQAVTARNFGGQRIIAPARNVGRIDDDAGVGIERAGSANTNGANSPAVFFPHLHEVINGAGHGPTH